MKPFELLNDDAHQPLIERLEGYFCDELSEVEVQQLSAELLADQAKQEVFIAYALLKQGILRVLRENEHLTASPTQTKAASVLTEPVRALIQELLRIEREAPAIPPAPPAPAQAAPEPKVIPYQPSLFRFAATVACLAASIIVLALLAPKPKLLPIPLATVAGVQNAVWGDSQAIATGGRLVNTEYVLQAGRAELVLDGGAMVFVEAPAAFKLLDENRMRLTHGAAFADVPEVAHGFQIATPLMDIVDLGTNFGVEVDRNGVATALVFDGEIAVGATGSKVEAAQHITEGMAVRVDVNGRLSAPTPADATKKAVFDGLRDMRHGIVSRSGTTRLVLSAASETLHANSLGEYIVLVPEQHGVVLSELVTVDSGATTDIAESQWQPTELAPGQRVRSYLMFFEDVGPDKYRHRRCSAHITFSEPVIGLIGRRKTLLSSQAIVGHPDLKYQRFSGLEVNVVGEPPQPERYPLDRVKLSADHRTLMIDLIATHTGDYMRVIVAHPDPLAVDPGLSQAIGTIPSE